LPAVSEEVPQPVLPTRALTPVEKGVLGHLYFALPGEVGAEKILEFIKRELALEPLWHRFAETIISIHIKGLAPHSATQWMSEFTAEEVGVIEGITGLSSQTFQTKDRGKALQRLILEQKRQNIQHSISLLKRQVQVAAAHAPGDVPSFINEVVALTQSLASLERQIQTEL
jgi:hypothetical protein